MMNDRIEKTLKKAKELKPSDCTHIKIVQGERCGINDMGRLTSWYATDCIYFNKDNEVIKREEIFSLGDRDYVDIENYILYDEGLYKPYSKENLKSIRRTYEKFLDYGMLEPINNLYSYEYECKMIIKEIIKNHKKSEVRFKFFMDYEFAENRWEKHLKGNKNYAVKGIIECDDLYYESDYDMDTMIWMMFDKAITELKNNYVENISISYDMKYEDEEMIIKRHNWGGLSWDD